MSKSFKYIFGPVPSRRLGLSLGIDLLGQKICSMDCIYCEVGKTKVLTLERKEYVPTEEVLDELKSFLKNLKTEKPNYITFSGMGEPTLHSKIGYIIDKIHEISNIPVCVLTNSTTITNKDVFHDLLKADLVIPSLDAVSSAVLVKINKPIEGINFHNVIKKLADFMKEFKGKLYLEILFVKGINDNDDELNELNKAVNIIKPDGLQIHTVARPSLSGRAEPVDEAFLDKARSYFSVNSLKIETFSQTNRMDYETDDDLVISLLKIRACHFEEIVKSTGLSKDKLTELLSGLNNSKKIKKFNFGNVTYFKVII